MKCFQLLRNAIPALVLSLILMPVAQAGPLADAVDKTIQQGSFTYDAQASINLEKGGELGAPFAMELSVREEGGKSQGVYGKSGAVWAELRDIDDTPREFEGLSKLNMMMDYNGAHIESSKTSYAEIESMAFSSDNEKMNKIMGMMNQMSKFFTGKSFKVSQEVLAERLSSLLGGGFYGPSEEELFLSALTGGNQSISELVNSFGVFADAMVESGFMKMEVVSSSQRKGRTGFSGGTTYVLSFGDVVTEEGAAVFQEALASFMRSIFPGVGQILADEITRESAAVISDDLTAFLQEAGKIDMELSVNVSNGVIQNTFFMMDLSALNVPLKIEETVSFNYDGGYQSTIPTDSNMIIDMNEIIDGFVTLAEMGSASFEEEVFFNDDFAGLPGGDTELSFGSYVYSDVQYILSICGEDKRCRRTEMRLVMQSLRELKMEGFLTGTDYTQAVRDLKKGLR